MNATSFEHHERCVETWLATQRGGTSGSELMSAVLLAGLRALWQRTRPTLGEVTLGAIFRRAIETAVRRHPEMAALGLRVSVRGSIEMQNQSPPRADLSSGVTFLLVEILRVLARLSAGTLTAALHAALTDATVERSQEVELVVAAEPEQADV